MVRLSHNGAFVIRGRLIMEDADRLSPEEINNRLAGAGLPAPAVPPTKAASVPNCSVLVLSLFLARI